MNWPLPHIKLLDDLSFLLLVCSLQLFWAVYTSDKVAANEPWERNSKYYCKTILLISLATVTAALFTVYNKGPTYKSVGFGHFFIFMLLFRGLSFEPPFKPRSNCRLRERTDMQENMWARLRDSHPGTRAIHAT